MRVRRVSLILGLVILFPVSALTQLSAPHIYVNPDFGFQTAFPEPPMIREVSYRKLDGTEVSAQQVYVDRGDDQFLVTVVNLPDGPAIDFDEFDHAVAQTRANGDALGDYEVSYDPGVPGWQLSIMQPDGRQRRAVIYNWAHKLIITEAVTAPGNLEGLRLEQSVILLNPDGTEVDTGSGSGNVAVERPE
jgi:hypothetical protein